ncbi:sugar phosphate isomerase/epimerase [Bacillus sp. 03113]|uniref:sugar phosphate isomerase/epimerase family protein n=1 Tax=Bacillus sp. 03113 TaxID=2578211 RepID=UPI001144C4F0|nr:sugar phosphate isomerase/epimerase [Bacillus sp. 03113]
MNTIVPLNAFDVKEVIEKGQDKFISSIFNAGAQGVEIRRELFATHSPNLTLIKEKLTKYSLLTVYSAPIPLWKKDFSFNIEEVQKVFAEAEIINASWVKLSLGHFDRKNSNLTELKSFLEKYDAITLLIENDQTVEGGKIEHLASFFESAYTNEIPLGMTFDIGNWKFVSEEIEIAIQKLARFVQYIHLKHVEEGETNLITLPIPLEMNANWMKIVKQIPNYQMIGLEFQVKSEKILENYIQFLQFSHTAKERFKCKSLK